ncbi:hypothetical protein PsorP6_003155 [Peronosclerospora sorghi]|uniref:Uncharacterized protein n=1 Tax=Peronosclerospora sorghi TaxID=230839 RepID=A0ACC0VP45_9STRA|nr:hypothetical protein PsorP6_003155 [Peronosclerospora sorghi]
MFIPTLENQASDEQQAKWLPLARNFKLLGKCSQTECGHGSNVQGIETVATYDKATQEVVLDSPIVTSQKWWPGGLGKTASHAIVNARLYLEGKDVGVQAVLVQIRSMNDHQPLPGIEVGVLVQRLAFNAVDNEYYPHPSREYADAYAKVLPDGTFVKPKSDKLVYLTMVQVRAYLINVLATNIGAATTICTRFSAARVQGRTPDNKGDFQVLDYQNQEYKLFPLLAISYSLAKMHDSALGVIHNGGSSFGAKLVELHASRRVLRLELPKNLPSIMRRSLFAVQQPGVQFCNVVGSITYEGTFDVLVKPHARYLLKNAGIYTSERGINEVFEPGKELKKKRR